MTPRQLVCGLAVMIAACIGGEASRPPPFLRSSGVSPGARQLVLVSGTPGPWGLHLEGDRLVVTKDVLRGNDVVVNGLRFPMRWDVSAQHFKAHDAGPRLSVVGERFFFDGEPVELPKGIKARNAWRAVDWGPWVIGLCRTSNTDEEAKLVPPFFASELVIFRKTDRKATVEWLTSFPPSDGYPVILDGEN